MAHPDPTSPDPAPRTAANSEPSRTPPRRFRRNIHVESENESPRGWSFVVTRGDSPTDRFEIHLSWPDYEFWSHGVAPPSRIVEAIMEAIEELRPDAELPSRFDASTARRIIGGTGLDEWLRERI